MPKKLISCAFVGGPLDGFIGWKRLSLQPGKFPLHGYETNRFRYVYQACKFLNEDDEEPLRMEFVQILHRKEEVEE